MAEIDRIYLDFPYFGSRRMAAFLRDRGYAVNRKRIQRLMRLMALEAVYPKPRTSAANPAHRVYPYLPGILRTISSITARFLRSSSGASTTAI